MILSNEERDKFCAYLRQNIDSAKEIVRQFEKMPPQVGDALIKRERKRILGWLIVLEDLEKMESFSVGGSGDDDA